MLCAELDASARSLTVTASLEVAAGRCLALTGPSGAGKSTLLRLLAGTARARRGRITLGETVWLDTAQRIDLPPEARRCGYVVQDYALFPHLRAWRNVAYGMRTAPRAERRAAAHAQLAALGLGDDHAARRPRQLSGGERQRVAIARALASEPCVLLLDEPLAALDAGTRASATRELSRVLGALAVPALLVTHDFEQAATLGDEVAVLDAGRIVQRGAPQEIAARPANPFVAELTGAVVLTGTARADGPLTLVELDGGGVATSTGVATGRVALAVHPWEVVLSPPHPAAASSARNQLPAVVRTITRIGNRVRVGLESGQPLAAELTEAAVAELALAPGQPVAASFKATATRLIPL